MVKRDSQAGVTYSRPSDAALKSALDQLGVATSSVAVPADQRLRRLAAAASLLGVAERTIIDVLVDAGRGEPLAAVTDPSALQHLLSSCEHEAGGWMTSHDRFDAMAGRLTLVAGTLSALSDQVSDHGQSRAELFVALAANLVGAAGGLISAAEQDCGGRAADAEASVAETIRVLDSLAAHLREYSR